jgi:hypothetical protein
LWWGVFGGRGPPPPPPPLQLPTQNMKVGAPLFAFFAKGGHDAACIAGHSFKSGQENHNLNARACLMPQL